MSESADAPSPSPWADLTRPPLREAALRSALVAPRGPLGGLRVTPTSASTNAELLADAGADPAPADLSVVVTEHQTAGKGRLGRTWITPAQTSLTFSLLLRPVGPPPATWSWLPVLTGLAVTRVVRRIAGCPAELKWPNDVLVDGRKLAGILVEVAPAAGERPASIVIGVGLNVSQTAEELPYENATSLAVEGAATTDRDPLARAVLRELVTVLARWREAGGDVEAAGLAAEARERMVTLGQRVRVHLPDDHAIIGVAEELDSHARLVVRSDAGSLHVVSAGDVQHVRPA